MNVKTYAGSIFVLFFDSGEEGSLFFQTILYILKKLHLKSVFIPTHTRQLYICKKINVIVLIKKVDKIQTIPSKKLDILDHPPLPFSV